MDAGAFTISGLRDGLYEAARAAHQQACSSFRDGNSLALTKLILRFDLTPAGDDIFEFANSGSERSVSAQYTHHVDGESVLQIGRNIGE